MSDIFTDDDLSQAEKYPSLGPEYFAGRRVAESFMAKFEADHFKPMVDEFTKQFREKLWSDVADYLIGDTENNLQSQIRYMVERTVQALLTGEKWALNQYALASLYDGEKIRSAPAAHIPAELQNARMADLEKENKRLSDNIKIYQHRF